MKVLFVINNFFLKGNGLCASARRTVHYLKEAGIDVRVLSGRNKDPEGPQPEYPLEDLNLPLFNSLIDAQGYQFASTDRKMIRQAVEWADLIHLEEPMILEAAAAISARKAGKAGGAMPALLVGADESAVRHFLRHEIKFTDIAAVITDVLEKYSGPAPKTLEDAVALTCEGERAADELCAKRRKI